MLNRFAKRDSCTLVTFLGLLVVFGVLDGAGPTEPGGQLHPHDHRCSAASRSYVVTSLNLTLGFLGQLALGHAGFMAIGAYTSALVTKAMQLGHQGGAPWRPCRMLLLFFIGLLAGALMAAVFGLLVGIPALRLRGDYLAIITLGFGEIIRVIIQNLPGRRQGLATARPVRR